MGREVVHTFSKSAGRRLDATLRSQECLAGVPPLCHRWKEPVQCLSSRIAALLERDAEEPQAGTQMSENGEWL